MDVLLAPRGFFRDTLAAPGAGVGGGRAAAAATAPFPAKKAAGYRRGCQDVVECEVGELLQYNGTERCSSLRMKSSALVMRCLAGLATGLAYSGSIQESVRGCRCRQRRAVRRHARCVWWWAVGGCSTAGQGRRDSGLVAGVVWAEPDLFCFHMRRDVDELYLCCLVFCCFV